MTGAIGAYVANEPSPVLVLLPTQADARDYVVSDVEPIFATSVGGRLAIVGVDVLKSTIRAAQPGAGDGRDERCTVTMDDPLTVGGHAWQRR